MAEDSVADLEAGDSFADFDYLTGGVAAHDEGVFDPAEHNVAHVLFQVVERVDSDGAVLDDDLNLARLGVGSRLDFEACRSGGDICCCVGRHAWFDEESGERRSTRFQRRRESLWE